MTAFFLVALLARVSGDHQKDVKAAWRSLGDFVEGRDAASLKTLQVSEEMSVDLSPDGKVYGTDLLNPRE